MDLNTTEPRLPTKIIAWLIHDRYREEILGDLNEYYTKLNAKNAKYINLKYWYQSLQFMRLYALKTPYENSNTTTMLKLNFKIAWRNLMREKFYSFINIFGLALGMITCLFIGIFIKDEMSYDKHWENSERIYRIVGDLKFENNQWHLATSPAPMAASFKKEFPEIEEAGRLQNIGTEFFDLGDRSIKANNVAFADQEIFKVFSFLKAEGTLDIAQPNTMVISSTMANKLFGDSPSAGKSVEWRGRTFLINGVYEDIPDNTHFQFDAIISMENNQDSKSTIWLSNNYRTYLLLDQNNKPDVLQTKFKDVYQKYFGPGLLAYAEVSWDQFLASDSFINYYLQPVEDIHLKSDLSHEIQQNGSFQYILLFGAAGLFVLIIACINFMNISTARSSTRAKEVGMRKVLGSKRGFLVNQFMMESTLNALIAAIISAVAVYLLLPFFNQLTDKSIVDPLFGDLFLVPWLLFGAIAVGLLAGIYPAFYLSGFRPLNVLKGELRLGVSSGWMRNILVVVQFGSSIILIFGAIVIASQLDFIQTKSLGFSKDQVLILENTFMLGEKIDAFREEVINHPAVVNATMTSFLPTSGNRSDTPVLPKSATTTENFVSMQQWPVDDGYIPTMNMTLVDGRNFDEKLASDSNAVILNEAAVEKLGFQNPVGELLKPIPGFDIFGMSEFRVVGVVKNFHYDSFKENIDPMMLLNVRSTSNIALQFQAENTTEVIEGMENLWQEFSPNLPFEYTFMDQQFAAKYASEEKLSALFNIFGGLAIFIACLGLFGLAAFTTDRRRKELGIRKVLGASLSQLVISQLSGYTKLLGVAILISLPVGIYLMSGWLENFVFRTNINWLMVVLPITGVMILAWLTVSSISYSAARQNPVNNLKQE